MIWLIFSFSSAKESQIYYKPTHVRFGSYAAGILLGYYIYGSADTNLNIPKVRNGLLRFYLERGH